MLFRSSVGIDYDDTGLANLIRATRVGGTEQVAQNTASQTAYLTRTFMATGLTMQDDPTALDWARFILYQTKDPELRFSALEILPQRDENNLYPQVLGREFGDKLRIARRPPGGGAATVRQVYIRGIGHEITQDDWRTVWVLQSATRWSFLVLDNNTLGRLDFNAVAF